MRTAPFISAAPQKENRTTYARILGMSSIVRVLSLLSDERRVQQRLSAILGIDVLTRDPTWLLYIMVVAVSGRHRLLPT